MVMLYVSTWVAILCGNSSSGSLSGVPVSYEVHERSAHKFYVSEVDKFVHAVKQAFITKRAIADNWNPNPREIAAVISA